MGGGEAGGDGSRERTAPGAADRQAGRLRAGRARSRSMGPGPNSTLCKSSPGSVSPEVCATQFYLQTGGFSMFKNIHTAASSKEV